MKNYQKIITSLILPILLLCSCGKQNEPEPRREFVDFHTELQANYLNDVYNHISPYADGTKELSKPKGYEISFSNPEHIMYAIYLYDNGGKYIDTAFYHIYF